jgi:hypothetical protein
VDALARHVTAFAKILTGWHGDRLDDWTAAVEADDQPDLHSFTHGIKRDYDAVKNGLTLQWSSGAVEGNVNRLKVLKRQMYGHAGFDLLRHRVLYHLTTRGQSRSQTQGWVPRSGPGLGKVLTPLAQP